MKKLKGATKLNFSFIFQNDDGAIIRFKIEKRVSGDGGQVVLHLLRGQSPESVRVADPDLDVVLGHLKISDVVEAPVPISRIAVESLSGPNLFRDLVGSGIQGTDPANSVTVNNTIELICSQQSKSAKLSAAISAAKLFCSTGLPLARTRWL